MALDLAAVRADNPVSITIRRGSATLAAQTVRIGKRGQGQRASGNTAEESRARVIVAGSTSLNIQPDDRFNDAAGVLYRVILVRPNRRADTIAEAEEVQ